MDIMERYDLPNKLIDKGIDKSPRSVKFNKPGLKSQFELKCVGGLAYVNGEAMTYDTFIYLWFYECGRGE